MKKNKVKEALTTRVITEDSPFAIREAFNQLRTNLMYTVDASGGTPVYAVTSTDEHAGKSTVIANLAVSFAHLNKKVLLIDGDMRCPVIHRFFNISRGEMGLSEVISGIVTETPKHNVFPNLDVIISGHIPPNPSELLTSARFSELIEQWKQEYDIILIDFPPMGIVTDCIANVNIVTAYMFVVRAGACSAKHINASLETMDQVGAKIAGIVLNDYDIKVSYRYNYKNYKYSKGYTSRYVTSQKDQSKK